MLSYWIKDSKGNEYPIRFDQGVFTQLAIAEDIPLNMAQKFFSGFASWPISRLYKLYFLAFQIASRKENKEFDFDYQSFLDWITEDQTIQEQINKVWEAAMPETDQKKTTPKAKPK